MWNRNELLAIIDDKSRSDEARKAALTFLHQHFFKPAPPCGIINLGNRARSLHMAQAKTMVAR